MRSQERERKRKKQQNRDAPSPHFQFGSVFKIQQKNINPEILVLLFNQEIRFAVPQGRVNLSEKMLSCFLKIILFPYSKSVQTALE